MDQSSSPSNVLEDDFHAYVDGALDPARHKEVQDYLDRHPEAALAVAQFREQRQLLRSALAPIADEVVPARLDLVRLAEGRPGSPRWFRKAAAIAFVAMGIGGLCGWQLRDAWQPGGGIYALAGEARSSYAAYAMGPLPEIDMGADQRAEFVKLVSAKLRRSIGLPDLSATGYRYIGGRIVATEFGPAGLFIYDRADGTRMALLVRPMLREHEASMQKYKSGSIGGYSWAARGLGYSVVGTEDVDALHPVANEARRQLAGLA